MAGGGDDVGERLPGPGRRKLIGVADDQQRHAIRRRLRRRLHRYEVGHRGLVDDQQVAVDVP